ncbi:MAG: hypothetical protein ACJA2L_001013, partial [Polaribacter sp.]
NELTDVQSYVGASASYILFDVIGVNSLFYFE